MPSVECHLHVIMPSDTGGTGTMNFLVDKKDHVLDAKELFIFPKLD